MEKPVVKFLEQFLGKSLITRETTRQNLTGIPERTPKVFSAETPIGIPG